MKAWIVSLCLLALLFGLIALNTSYVHRVADHICREAEALTIGDVPSDERLSSLEKYWEKHRPLVALSIAHRELDRLSEALIALRAAYDAGADADFTIQRQLVINAASELSRLEEISVENLF